MKLSDALAATATPSSVAAQTAELAICSRANGAAPVVLAVVGLILHGSSDGRVGSKVLNGKGRDTTVGRCVSSEQGPTTRERRLLHGVPVRVRDIRPCRQPCVSPHNEMVKAYEIQARGRPGRPR